MKEQRAKILCVIILSFFESIYSFGWLMGNDVSEKAVVCCSLAGSEAK